MRLVSIKFSECEGTQQEWTFDGLRLGASNLIVGKNASGKTRILNVISSLATFLSGTAPLGMNGDFFATFDDNGKSLHYILKIEQSQVLVERFSIDGTILLNRGENGVGTIQANAVDGGSKIPFQTPPVQLAAVARRDAIQHPFLEPLHVWASSLRIYRFGTFLGKDRLAILTNGGFPWDEKDPNQIVALFRQANAEFKDDFKNSLIQDMCQLGYEVSDVDIKPPTSIHFFGPPGALVGLCVQERDLPGITDQNCMSQGMFRALSILIQVNYSQMAKRATCILIDDIGEGLDFDRSCRLIELLRRKAEASNIQLILSTNDRFVMNHVPLEEWSVLQRRGGHVQVRNYDNSRDVFEEFKFTGLSNFSFLEMDFVNGANVEEAVSHE